MRRPSLSNSKLFIRVGDVKQYFFCPRKIYFLYGLHIPQKIDLKMTYGCKGHTNIETLEKRRKGAIFYDKRRNMAQKFYKKYLLSEKLKLTGVLDCLIQIERGYIPVEYKMGKSKKGGAYVDHRYQLTGYALLVEETYKCIVKTGFLYYVNEKIVEKIQITSTMKTKVEEAIDDICDIISKEILREPVEQEKQCISCEFRKMCRRI